MNKVTYIIIRILFGCVFLVSGIMKGLEFNTTIQTVILYLETFGFNELNPIAIWASVIVIGIEILIGLLLVFDLYPKITILCSALLSLFFTILTYFIVKWNLFDECGCFGSAIDLNATTSFYKNLVLTFMSLFLVYQNIRQRRVQRAKRNHISLSVMLIFVFVFCIQALIFPAIIDTKYYAKGSNTLKISKEHPLFVIDIPNTNQYIEYQEVIDNLGQITKPVVIGFIKDETKIALSEQMSFKNTLKQMAADMGGFAFALTTDVLNHDNNIAKYAHQLATFNIDNALYNSVFDSEYGILVLSRGTIIEKNDFNWFSIKFAIAITNQKLHRWIFNINVIRILFIVILCIVILSAVFYKNIASFFRQSSHSPVIMELMHPRIIRKECHSKTDMS